ncbi:flavin-dependent oxidoreductase [Rhodovulum sp. DZ06]|uniref:flavin-dependent oxidoreductase n=1 Tax=Rhodovulum sp. DZ06 TaxID=3425126 RepID=UPI003D333042
MTVIIAGAGIGGLTLGLSLHQAGIPFQIYEAVETIAPLGVGINVQPHAVRELAELGLLPDLDRIALRTEEVVYAAKNGKDIWAEPRGAGAGYKWPQFSIHRGRMQMMLLERLKQRAGEDVIKTGISCLNWHEEGDEIVVTLGARSTGEVIGSARGTVFVAADGIHSAARKLLFPTEGAPVWGGTMMWRGVTIGPRYRTGRSMAMIGDKDTKFVCYPIDDAGEGLSVINWIADLTLPMDTLDSRADWTLEGKAEDVLPRFDGYNYDWIDVPAIIRGAEKIYEYPMVDRDPLGAWTHGRMTLLGDAAHAMYPIGSNGASQAIIDARVMVAKFLELGVGPAALMAYDEARRPAVNAVVLANRGDGPDKVLDLVEERAPDGFEDIEEVITRAELEQMAANYKKTAGMDVEGLNGRPDIVPLPHVAPEEVPGDF